MTQASLQSTLPASTIFESWLAMDSETFRKSNCNARVGKALGGAETAARVTASRCVNQISTAKPNGITLPHRAGAAGAGTRERNDGGMSAGRGLAAQLQRRGARRSPLRGAAAVRGARRYGRRFLR